MDNNKLYEMVTSLRDARMFVLQDDRNDPHRFQSKNYIHNTQFNNFNVEISKCSSVEDETAAFTILFKNKTDDNEVFRITFSYHNNIYAEKDDNFIVKTSKLYIEREPIKDIEQINNILNESNFEQFLDKIIVEAKEKIAVSLAVENEIRKQEGLAKEAALTHLRSNLKDMPIESSISLDNLQKKISTIVHHKESPIKGTEETEDLKFIRPFEPKISVYNSKFKNFEVSIKHTKDNAKSTSYTDIQFINNEKNLNFVFTFKDDTLPHTWSSHQSKTLRIDKSYIRDENIIKEIINKSGLNEYLNTEFKSLIDLEDFDIKDESKSENEPSTRQDKGAISSIIDRLRNSFLGGDKKEKDKGLHQ